MGLRSVAHEIYRVHPEDFACFNLATDNAKKVTEQVISTTHTILNFKTENGAIGFAIDCGTHIDVYMTGNATLTISGATVTAVETGTYSSNGTFTSSESLGTDSTVNLSACTLYRISYKDAGVQESTTWDAIGG